MWGGMPSGCLVCTSKVYLLSGKLFAIFGNPLTLWEGQSSPPEVPECQSIIKYRKFKKNVISNTSSSHPLTTTNLLSVSTNLPVLDNPCIRNPVTCNLLFPGFFYLAQWFQVPSMLLHESAPHSFIYLNHNLL